LRGKKARIAEKVERRVGADQVAKKEEVAVASDETIQETTPEIVTETNASEEAAAKTKAEGSKDK